MGRSRYLITEPDRAHFLTCTIVEWLPVFSVPEAAHIILESWNYLRQHAGFQLYGYVILENHLHFIASSSNLDKDVYRFKSYTARRIVDHLITIQQMGLLNLLQTVMKNHKADRAYQLWQEGVHAEMIMSDEMMRQKLEYIHANPVKRGYVDVPEHWRYSSARNYAEDKGLIDLDPWWE